MISTNSEELIHSRTLCLHR